MDKELYELATQLLFNYYFNGKNKSWDFDNPERKDHYFKRVKKLYFALEQTKKEIELLKQ